MKKTLLLTGLLIFAGQAANAETSTPPAEPPVPPRRPFGNMALPEIMKPFDLNNDGRLSPPERQAFERAMREQQWKETFKKIDTNGDGKLSPEEIKVAQEEARKKVDALRDQRFDELDRNNDGFLNRWEFHPPASLSPAELSAVFYRLDANHDEKISKAEFLIGQVPGLPGSSQPTPPGSQEEARLRNEVLRRQIFDEQDRNRDGLLERWEFHPPARLTSGEVSAAFYRVDTDRNQKISKAEFLVGQIPGIPGPIPVPPSPRN